MIINNNGHYINRVERAIFGCSIGKEWYAKYYYEVKKHTLFSGPYSIKRNI